MFVIYVSNWNNCEQYLECIKCSVMLSPLKKREPVWSKLSAHFSAWSLSTKELIWDNVILPKELAGLELCSVCKTIKAIMITVYGPWQNTAVFLSGFEHYSINVSPVHMLSMKLTQNISTWTIWMSVCTRNEEKFSWKNTMWLSNLQL